METNYNYDDYNETRLHTHDVIGAYMVLIPIIKELLENDEVVPIDPFDREESLTGELINPNIYPDY